VSIIPFFPFLLSVSATYCSVWRVLDTAFPRSETDVRGSFFFLSGLDEVFFSNSSPFSPKEFFSLGISSDTYTRAALAFFFFR